MDKINFYKKVIDKFFEKCKGNKLLFKSALFYFGGYYMIGAIMVIDNDLSREEMEAIYNYFDECQHNAENK